MDRRRFFQIVKDFLLLILGAMGFGSCIKNGRPPELLLTGDVDADAKAIKKIYYRIEQIATDPLDELRVGWLNDNDDVKVVSLSYNENVKGDKRVVLLDEDTGKVSYLGFGIKDLSPSIKFMDNNNKILLDGNGREMEYALLDFNKQGAPAKKLDATDWLVFGIKAAAVGFAIWLGFKILGLVAAAIGFIAFNIMVIGIFLVAGVAVVSAVKWLLDKTDWDYDSARNFFGKAADDIKALFQEVALEFGG